MNVLKQNDPETTRKNNKPHNINGYGVFYMETATVSYTLINIGMCMCQWFAPNVP